MDIGCICQFGIAKRSDVVIGIKLAIITWIEEFKSFPIRTIRTISFPRFLFTQSIIVHIFKEVLLVLVDEIDTDTEISGQLSFDADCKLIGVRSRRIQIDLVFELIGKGIRRQNTECEVIARIWNLVIVVVHPIPASGAGVVRICK